MEEKVYFENSNGDKLCGLLSETKEAGKSTIIILCHGFTTSKDNFTNKSLKKILNESGIATFRFDFFGHGESEGPFEEITVSEGADDILNAIKYLKEKGYLRIGLFGSSFGGIASVIAASKTKDIFALATKSPVSDYPEVRKNKLGQKKIDEWKKKGYKTHVNGAGRQMKLNYTMYSDSEKNIAYNVAKKISIPTLIVHGDKDPEVPVKQSIKISAMIHNCRLEIIMGADHQYSGPGQFDEMIKVVSEFIIKISNDPKAL